MTNSSISVDVLINSRELKSSEYIVDGDSLDSHKYVVLYDGKKINDVTMIVRNKSLENI